MLMKAEKLVIRADASTQIGTGHVMRCLALAQAWYDRGGQAIFIMATEAPALAARLKSEGIEVLHLAVQQGSVDDAVQTSKIAQQMNTSWVIVDGYHFGSDYQRIIKDSGKRLLFIDDNRHADHYYADIVLNQNLHADENLYVNREPYTKLLLGTRYVLLRREFLKKQGWKRKIGEVARKILATLGGGDSDNVTLKVIHALQQVRVDSLEVVVVIGGSNPHLEELQSSIHNSPLTIRLEHNVTSMSELMAWADVAISSASTTAWELAFMGLPILALVLADNQRPIAELLSIRKVAVNLGWHKNISVSKITQALTELLLMVEKRSEMSSRGQRLVDGHGVSRVAEQIIKMNMLNTK